MNARVALLLALLPLAACGVKAQDTQASGAASKAQAQSQTQTSR